MNCTCTLGDYDARGNCIVCGGHVVRVNPRVSARREPLLELDHDAIADALNNIASATRDLAQAFTELAQAARADEEASKLAQAARADEAKP